MTALAALLQRLDVNPANIAENVNVAYRYADDIEARRTGALSFESIDSLGNPS